MKVLVTGAAGFIGYSLCKRLLEDEGINLVAIDNFNDYYDTSLKYSRSASLSELSPDFKINKIDLKDADEVDSFFSSEKPDIVCHLAAQACVRYSIEYPQTYIDNNITATVNLLEASHRNKVKDFVFASTSSVYGLSQEMPFTEETPIDSTISTYSSTKRCCELLCHTYHNLYNIRFRIMRFFTVYGPWGRPDMALFLFCKSILENKPITIFNEGQMKRDFTYIDDIVQGFRLAIFNKSKFEIFNLGSSNPINLMDFVSTLENILNMDAEKIYAPMQPGDVKATWADISKSRKILGYNPKIELKEGVSNFVSWYLNYYGRE